MALIFVFSFDAGMAVQWIAEGDAFFMMCDGIQGCGWHFVGDFEFHDPQSNGS